MASGPIAAWQIEGKNVDVVTDLLFLGSKITADSDCSHEIRRQLLLGWKAMTNLDSVLKSRDIALPSKVCTVKAVVFPVVIYGCESWTVQKAAPKNWCLWTVVLQKTSESPLDSKIKPVNLKGDQPWIFTGRTDAEAEAPVFLSLKQADDSLEKSLILEKIEGRRRRGCQRMRWLDLITNAVNMTLGKLREMVRDREAWSAAIPGVTKCQTRLGDWTTTATTLIRNISAALEKKAMPEHLCFSKNFKVILICV